jgi:hypothetical protein
VNPLRWIEVLLEIKSFWMSIAILIALKPLPRLPIRPSGTFFSIA